MSDFNKCLQFVLTHEGGILQDKVTGEYSNFGITQNLLKAINYGIKDPKDLRPVDAQNIYKQQFWDKYNLRLINSDKLAAKVFDMIVNMGPKSAAMIIQKALKFDKWQIDGILGHWTICNLNEWPSESNLLNYISQGCEDYYKEIAVDEKAKYLNGWLNRAKDLPA